MPNYQTADIRNIALVGHGGAGKTSLTEALLQAAGVIGAAGAVEKGDTVTDFSDEEKHHGHSLFSAAVHIDHDGKHINLIDTPGYPDFLGQSLQVLPAVETAAVVISATAGIESVTRRMMDRAKQRNLCRMIVINKIDHENIDLPGLIVQIREAFGPECLPVNLPAEGGKNVVDCFATAEGDSDLGSVADWHTHIVDQVVELDDKLMEMYLEQGEVKPEQLHEPFERALREGHLVPVFFTAARRHEGGTTGIEELLKDICQLAPSPLEGNPKVFMKDEKRVEVLPDASKPAVAHVYQVMIDPFVGKLSAFRVHQGTVTTASQLHISDGDSRKPIKISHLYKLQGKEHIEVKEAIPGDIVAVAKVEDIHRDSTLYVADAHAHMHLLRIVFPEPMSGLAITAKKRGDEQKISDALHKIEEEDPTFKVTRDAITHETVIHGMGELHLRVILERLKQRFRVEVDTKQPKIAYRETIMGGAEGHHRHKKQSGGSGQFGEVFLRVAPLERGAGFEFVDATFGGSIPHQLIPAVEKGVRQVMQSGAVAGYPMQDIKVEVYDGKHHPVDSKEVAFITAGKRAFIDAVQKAKPVLLEPCVNLEVVVPNQHMGDITGDLSGKRGRIQGTDMVSGDQAMIRAMVPLAEVANYQNQLKSVTGGQGTFTMELSHYEPVPSHVQEQIVATYKPHQEED